MATPLSEAYDAFFIKSGLDWAGKEDQVYQFLKTAISKCVKTVSVDLSYTLDETTTTDEYDGEFINTLEQDAIELIALNMLLEQYRQRYTELVYLKKHLGTKDFNKLNDKADEFKTIAQSMKDLQDEIFIFRQEFYSYKES